MWSTKLISATSASVASGFLVLLAIGCHQRVTGFLGPNVFVSQTNKNRADSKYNMDILHTGFGVAKDYGWKEDPMEMEITVLVPSDIRAKDVVFKAKQTSIDLRIKGTEEGEEDVILLDVNRKMRGRVALDGTYWVISDQEDDRSKREITVTIEKSTQSRDDFDAADDDWGGVYPNDEDEILEKKYEVAEPLDVREYAASMGVDIDNINMSMVDKTMFSSGLNMTKQTLDQMSKAGYVDEVTQQADGTEYTTNTEGEAVAYSPFGDSVGEDEIREASDTTTSTEPPKIPFLDTSSPWDKNVPVEDITIGDETFRAAVVPDTDENINDEADFKAKEASVKDTIDSDKQASSDPIDILTVKRLKEILREQNLKVSGTKQELRDRLRAHVQDKMN